MPYKDPERKRQWEREHREQRSTRRTAQRLNARLGQLSIPMPSPDPLADYDGMYEMTSHYVHVTAFSTRGNYHASPFRCASQDADEVPP